MITGAWPYLGLPLETLTRSLWRSQAALPVFEAVGSISTGDQRISFVPTTAALIHSNIPYLQAAIAAATGNSAPESVYLIGGVGL